jgi:hypothetical protein
MFLVTEYGFFWRQQVCEITTVYSLASVSFLSSRTFS